MQIRMPIEGIPHQLLFRVVNKLALLIGRVRMRSVAGPKPASARHYREDGRQTLPYGSHPDSGSSRGNRQTFPRLRAGGFSSLPDRTDEPRRTAPVAFVGGFRQLPVLSMLPCTRSAPVAGSWCFHPRATRFIASNRARGVCGRRGAVSGTLIPPNARSPPVACLRRVSGTYRGPESQPARVRTDVPRCAAFPTVPKKSDGTEVGTTRRRIPIFPYISMPYAIRCRERSGDGHAAGISRPFLLSERLLSERLIVAIRWTRSDLAGIAARRRLSKPVSGNPAGVPGPRVSPE